MISCCWSESNTSEQNWSANQITFPPIEKHAEKEHKDQSGPHYHNLAQYHDWSTGILSQINALYHGVNTGKCCLMFVSILRPYVMHHFPNLQLLFNCKHTFYSGPDPDLYKRNIRNMSNTIREWQNIFMCFEVMRLKTICSSCANSEHHSW